MKNHEEGFTLLEVITSIAIIGIIMFIFIGVIRYTGLNIRNSDQKSEAVRIGEQELNEKLQDISVHPDHFYLHTKDIVEIANYQVWIMETEFPNNFLTLADPDKYISVQGITIYTDSNGVHRKGLVTVAVKWKE